MGERCPHRGENGQAPEDQLKLAAGGRLAPGGCLQSAAAAWSARWVVRAMLLQASRNFGISTKTWIDWGFSLRYGPRKPGKVVNP